MMHWSYTTNTWRHVWPIWSVVAAVVVGLTVVVGLCLLVLAWRLR